MHSTIEGPGLPWHQRKLFEREKVDNMCERLSQALTGGLVFYYIVNMGLLNMVEFIIQQLSVGLGSFTIILYHVY